MNSNAGVSTKVYLISLRTKKSAILYPQQFGQATADGLVSNVTRCSDHRRDKWMRGYSPRVNDRSSSVSVVILEIIVANEHGVSSHRQIDSELVVETFVTLLVWYFHQQLARKQAAHDIKVVEGGPATAQTLVQHIALNAGNCGVALFLPILDASLQCPDVAWYS